MRDNSERLRDILEAIAQIEKYAKRGKSAFEQDELIQNWIVHRLQIIGEACRHFTTAISPSIRQMLKRNKWPCLSLVRPF